MMKRRQVILLAALLSASATLLRAQSSVGSWEVSPFAGYLFGGTVFEQKDSLRHDSSFKGSLLDHPSYGLRLGYAFRSGLEPELEWSGVETSVQLKAPFTPSRYPARMDFFLAGLTYNLGADRIRPYVNLSAGAARLSGPVPDASAAFTGKLALGLKAFLTPLLGLRLEAGGYATRLGNTAFGVACTSFVVIDGKPELETCTNRWMTNGQLSGGLVFAF